MSIPVNDSIQSNSPKALENRAGKFSGGTWQPYATVAEANASVPSAYRHRALTVCILEAGVLTEYWYKDGIADINLVAKTTPAPAQVVYAVESGLTQLPAVSGQPTKFVLGGDLTGDTEIDAKEHSFAIWSLDRMDFEVDEGVGVARTGWVWIGMGADGSGEFSDGVEKVFQMEVRNALKPNESTWVTIKSDRIEFWHSKGVTTNGYDKTVIPRIHGTLAGLVNGIKAGADGNVILESVQTLTDAPTVTWNLDSGRIGKLTAAGNRTIDVVLGTATGVVRGSIILRQDNVGGRTLVLPGYLQSGSVYSANPNDVDVLDFMYDGTTFYWKITNFGAVPEVLTPFLSPALQAKFLYLWSGEFTGDNLASEIDGSVITVTGKDFATDYIPAGSAATFAIPDNATFKTADEDDFWSLAGAVLQKTPAELVATDNTRTFIKYSNTAPYDIQAIGILKTGEVLTEAEKDELDTAFQLWVMYWGALSENGVVKDNRSVDPLDNNFNAAYNYVGAGGTPTVRLYAKAMSGGAQPVIDWGDGTTTPIPMTDEDYITNVYSDFHSHTYAADGMKNIVISNCDRLILLNNMGFNDYQFNASLDEFQKCTNLKEMKIIYAYGGAYTGSLNLLPASLKRLELISIPGTFTPLNLATLPRGLERIIVDLAPGQQTMNLNLLPEFTALNRFELQGNTAGGISGTPASLPATLQHLRLSDTGASSFGINGPTLPVGLLTLHLTSYNHVGEILISQLPAGLTSLYIDFTPGFRGNLADLPNALTFIDVQRQAAGEITFSGTAKELPALTGTANKINVSFGNFDAFLNSWAATASTNEASLYLVYTEQHRTAASDAAIATLITKNKTVSATVI